MKKINYIVTIYCDTETINTPTKTTEDSIRENLGVEDKVTNLFWGDKTEEEVINEYISTLKEDEFTHICIINDGSILKDNFSRVMNTYVDNNETVYLPIVELNNDSDNKGVLSFKGFLNSSIWKPYFAEEVGVLDLPLSKRGVDLILYGALIPLSVVKKYKFKPEIKYYSSFEFLNRIINSSIPVLGIPKVTFKCITDYELKGVTKEEKVKFFKLATTDYLVG